ncbi:MAG TPA: M24 family metallopeptidase [Gaiellaceae bacterium]
MSEAERKRRAALEAAGGAPLVVSAPENVRWLLCGRGRPVDVGSADYTVVLRDGEAFVLYAGIEQSRVESEERFEELGYEPIPFPWHEGREATVSRLAPRARTDGELERELAPHRQGLGDEEVERYRAAGADAAAAFVEAIGTLRPELTELEAAGELARATRNRDLIARVNLVAGEERQPVHRHPLPTSAPLGRHALLAFTVERDGLHVSMTRIVSFGPPPERLVHLVRAAAEVDAAVISASRPGARHGELFDVIAEAYERAGFSEEWRRHHQGGLTGYKGREVFAVPGEPTPLPPAGAVAWNPSITGGGKSEDTVLVTAAGHEILTRTPELPELETAGLPRPAIVEL